MIKRHFLYSLFMIILSVSGCSRHNDENSVRVMTFNIRYDNPQDSIYAWSKRAVQLYSFIHKLKPDIVGMQEAMWNQYTFLDTVLTEYASVAVGRSDGVRDGETNPLFYRKDKFDMVRTKTFWLSPTPEVAGSMDWGSGLPRIVTWMELVNKNTHNHLFAFNTHFAHDSDSARVMSSQLLLSKVDSISAGFPFIITGDFNMLPESRGYAILTGPFESVPLFIDSYGISEKKPYGPKYTFNGFSERPSEGRIDYIFVKPGMKVMEHNTYIRKEKGIYISDHWPVEAIVTVE